MSRPSSRSASKRFSREGFKPLPNDMANHDARIDIPLESVRPNSAEQASQGSTTAVHTNNTSAQSRKRQMFRGRRSRPVSMGYRSRKVGYDGEEDTVNTMGKVYKQIMAFSVLTRYLLYIIPLAAIFAIPIIVGATTGNEAQIGGVPTLWFFTWIEIVWCSLWGSKVVAHYLPAVFRIFAGVVSSGVRKYSEVIRALEIPLSLVGWAVTSLATFKPLMTRNPYNAAECDRLQNKNPPQDCGKEWVNVLQKILAAATIAALIYLAEKTIIQLISINYHRKQFNARIRGSKHNIWILGLLYEASRNLFPMFCQEFAEEDYSIADQLNISRVDGKKTPGHGKSGSHTPMRVIQDIGHAADKLTSLFGNVASEVTGKNVFNPNSAHSIVIEALEKNRTAEALARRIWMSFVVEGRESLSIEDVIDVMGPDRKVEAEEAFWVLDSDGNGDISLDEMILTVAEFGRERKSISSSMHDVDQAINVLDRLLATVAFIIIVLVFVAFLNSSFTTTLATTGTALLSLSFVFSATCQEVLGSCIFLFVKHPFDIGDRVDIASSGASNQEQFVVEHISLLFTVFRHVTGPGVGRICQIPNIVLNTLWVENISRSKALTEQLSIDISFDTTFDDIQILKNELLTFVTDKDNSRDFQPDIDVDILGTSDQSKLSLMVEIKHKSNWANESVRRARRSKFMCALVSALKAVPIYAPGGGADAAGSAALPTYSVAISHSEAKEFAHEASKDREGARLVPKKKLDEVKDRLSPSNSSENKYGMGMTMHETKVVDDLTSRDPAIDPVRDGTPANSARADSTTLGDLDRPGIDPQDEQDLRGILRRESTRGKRKPSREHMRQIPTIYEPEGEYATRLDTTLPSTRFAGYENQRPTTYSTMPAAYRQYQPPPSLPIIPPHAEMSQIPTPLARSPSNPYRGGDFGRQTLSPRLATTEEEEDGRAGGDVRPYSGV